MKNFVTRHKILSVILVLFVVGIIGGSIGGNKGETTASNTTSNTPSTTNTTKQTTPQTVTETPKDSSIKAGMYKVGKDIEAGEYVILSNGYMEISKDSTGGIESIIANDNIQNRSIVTIKDGQYFELTTGKIYPISEAPKVVAEDGILPSGTYKVGVDIKAGEYKVASESNGYYEVTSDSTHSMNSIVANDIFTGEKYITIKDGQYLKLMNASLKVN